MKFFLIFILTLFSAFHNVTESISTADDSAKLRSAQLVVSTVERDYLAVYTKKGGVAPDLVELATVVKNDLTSVKSVTPVTNSDPKTLTVVTSDDVSCIFEIDDSSTLILKDGKCGDIAVKDETIEIGIITNK